jgi:hypothetical protein
LSFLTWPAVLKAALLGSVPSNDMVTPVAQLHDTASTSRQAGRQAACQQLGQHAATTHVRSRYHNWVQVLATHTCTRPKSCNMSAVSCSA